MVDVSDSFQPANHVRSHMVESLSVLMGYTCWFMFQGVWAYMYALYVIESRLLLPSFYLYLSLSCVCVLSLLSLLSLL